ncbi:phospholipase D-like domain-containing protein [Thaumasiovibrio subtropicus]|uniref:phospholipase D-like domain-containing protein n=1 Tax=Thaumasiovibrio subtropicus TaxID=1891207 RepID=UPI000B363053|nr:phospholipase D-like domain-containing protein [Thaumasiovibrio subtropicus]
MNKHQLAEWITTSLDDFKLDDSERRELSATLSDLDMADEDRGFIRNHTFRLAQQALGEGGDPAMIVRWLERIVKVLDNSRPSAEPVIAESWFSPGRACANGITQHLRSARHSIDICVFTIADDDLSKEILRAHERGVKVRLVTDAEKLHDRGSDIDYLARKGVPIKIDDTNYHMHHKFAIFDGQRMINGSFNWTRSASKYNQEDITLTDDPRFVGKYLARFETLWERFPQYN